MHGKKAISRVQERKKRKMNKLVAIDLDGTMLNQYGVVTQKTKEAIERAQLKGIEVIIAAL